MTAPDLTPDPDLIEATEDDLRAAVRNALARAELTFDQLAEQARVGQFQSVRARMAWTAIGDLGHLADPDRDPARLAALLADALDRLSEACAAERVHTRRQHHQRGEPPMTAAERHRAAIAAANADMFGITCIDCGEAITDDTPWGEVEPGPETEGGPVHLACADDAS